MFRLVRVGVASVLLVFAAFMYAVSSIARRLERPSPGPIEEAACREKPEEGE